MVEIFLSGAKIAISRATLLAWLKRELILNVILKNIYFNYPFPRLKNKQTKKKRENIKTQTFATQLDISNRPTGRKSVREEKRASDSVTSSQGPP